MEMLIRSLVMTIIVAMSMASSGDENPYYQNCVKNCVIDNCTGDGLDFKDGYTQPLALRLTFWSCRDECQYNCMWITVDAYLEKSWDIPQFHGKWPFLRVLGVQEPVSMVASLLNLCSHYYMLQRFRKAVRRQAPLYWLWQLYSFVCINAWFWSAVFHARDIPFTEKMDYLCAFSILAFSLCCMFIRFADGQLHYLSFVMSATCFIGFSVHTTYILTMKFDYGLNMKINIAVGVFNALGWLIWCGCSVRSQPYVWRLALFVILAGVCLVLEVLDFPPLWGLVDAHALWHISTIALPFIFYRFTIDDCKFLYNKHKKKDTYTDKDFNKSKSS
ncbi:post-GPI attachment to proteins factor 3 [Anabrus simplex]|uniref:post-GPI attachment to proteins factor 3 n=1 Tax=Anabrus simplex TaxID=316456 RepID=UPI0034DD882A